MGVSGFSHLVIVLFTDVSVRFIAFLIFEACVGMYFPMIGTLKGDIVPEDMRSTIYNIYRFPLNVAVLMPLLMNFSITTTFMLTSTILIVAGVCSFCLMQLRAVASELPRSGEHGDALEMEPIAMGKEDDAA